MFIFLLQYVLLLAVGIFAMKMGGAAERQGACWLLINVVFHAMLSLGDVTSPTPQLIGDGVYATGLLPLAFIHMSWWIGVMAMIECASFLLQAVYLVTDKPTDLMFVQVNNGLFLAALLTLLTSAIASMVQRRVRRAPDPLVEGLPA